MSQHKTVAETKLKRPTLKGLLKWLGSLKKSRKTVGGINSQKIRNIPLKNNTKPNKRKCGDVTFFLKNFAKQICSYTSQPEITKVPPTFF